jgi:ATP-dependent RNA helicase DeaD
MSSFDDFNLSPPVLEALRKMGFVEPTPIQKKGLPLVLDGRDVLGQAQTGTGKTAAFGIPMAEKIPTDLGGVGAIVLCPTRELAVQVSEEIHEICLFSGHKVLPVYGGQRIDRQITALKKGVHIVVGTPGRILDHLGRGTLDLSSVGMLVLDEADMMLDMGFLPDIRRILRKTPPERQTLLFSATIPLEIQRISSSYMRDPEFVSVVPETLTVQETEQIFYEVPEEEKIDALMRLLDYEEEGGTAMIFCRTKRNVDKLARKLKSRGYDVEGLHGDLTQQQRDRIMADFREGRFAYLVATDVAARGLDISHVTHVINYHIPQDPEAYVHRIGRTGRMGRAGVAITFVTPAEYWDLLRIQEFSMAQIEPGELPSDSEVEERRRAARGDEAARQRVLEADLKGAAREPAAVGRGATAGFGLADGPRELETAAAVGEALNTEEPRPASKRRGKKESEPFEALPGTGVEPTTEAERHQRRHTLRDAQKRIEWTEAEEAIKEAARIEREQLIDSVHEQALEDSPAAEAAGRDRDAALEAEQSARTAAEERRRREVEERLREAEKLAAESPAREVDEAPAAERERRLAEIVPFPAKPPSEDEAAPVEVSAAAEAVTREEPAEAEREEAEVSERMCRCGGHGPRAEQETAAEGVTGTPTGTEGAEKAEDGLRPAAIFSPSEEERIQRALQLRDWALELLAGLDEGDLKDYLAVVDRVLLDYDLRSLTAALLREFAVRELESPRTAARSALEPEQSDEDERPSDAAMTRLFVSVGRRARVTKEGLRKLVRETAGIGEDDLGRVDLLHNFAFVEVRKAVASQVVEAMHESVFKGREISVEPAKSTGKDVADEESSGGS